MPGPNQQEEKNMRYTRTIKEQLDVVESHAGKKVQDLVRLSKQAKRIMEKKPNEKEKLDHIFQVMFDITEQLKPVEGWVKQNWPEITELYDAVQSAVKRTE
jgi:hypothetical protein